MNSDEDIKLRVEAALARDPRIDARNLGVNVREGVATLLGSVAHCVQRRLAAEVAAGELSDAEIAEWVASVLHHTFPVSSQNIRVLVNQRWVTFAGQLDTSSEKAAAESALIAHRHAGIKGIFNGITLKPKGAAFGRAASSSTSREMR